MIGEPHGLDISGQSIIHQESVILRPEEDKNNRGTFGVQSLCRDGRLNRKVETNHEATPKHLESEFHQRQIFFTLC